MEGKKSLPRITTLNSPRSGQRCPGSMLRHRCLIASRESYFQNCVVEQFRSPTCRAGRDYKLNRRRVRPGIAFNRG